MAVNMYQEIGTKYACIENFSMMVEIVVIYILLEHYNFPVVLLRNHQVGQTPEEIRQNNSKKLRKRENVIINI